VLELAERYLVIGLISINLQKSMTWDIVVIIGGGGVEYCVRGVDYATGQDCTGDCSGSSSATATAATASFHCLAVVLLGHGLLFICCRGCHHINNELSMHGGGLGGDTTPYQDAIL
jgi:hypothetical protein